jgi:hypothetical protein
MRQGNKGRGDKGKRSAGVSGYLSIEVWEGLRNGVSEKYYKVIDENIGRPGNGI